MVDRHTNAALVINTNDVDARAGQRTCDGDVGDLIGQHPQTSHTQGGRDHDEGLATIPQKRLCGPAVVNGADDGRENQLMPAGLRRRIQAVDDFRVEGLVDAERDPDEPRSGRAQGSGPLVGAIAQAGCDGLDPAPGLLGRTGGIAHDDRGQRDRAVRLLRDVEQRHPLAASSRHNKTPESQGIRGGGGGWGIRTPEGLHPTRFPSVRHRPLGESSRRSTRRQPRATRKEYIGPPIPGASPGRWDLSRGAGLAASAPRGRTAGLGDAPAGTVLEPYGASSTSGGGGGGGSQPGAGSGSLSLGPSCGVIQRIPQDRKVARVSRLWRVREGSSRLPQRRVRGLSGLWAGRSARVASRRARRRPAVLLLWYSTRVELYCLEDGCTPRGPGARSVRTTPGQDTPNLVK